MNKLNLKLKSGQQQCQRCLKYGHWTYECKNKPAYTYRPSRTMMFKNKDLRIETKEEEDKKIVVNDNDFEKESE